MTFSLFFVVGIDINVNTLLEKIVAGTDSSSIGSKVTVLYSTCFQRTSVMALTFYILYFRLYVDRRAREGLTKYVHKRTYWSCLLYSSNTANSKLVRWWWWAWSRHISPTIHETKLKIFFLFFTPPPKLFAPTTERWQPSNIFWLKNGTVVPPRRFMSSFDFL